MKPSTDELKIDKTRTYKKVERLCFILPLDKECFLLFRFTVSTVSCPRSVVTGSAELGRHLVWLNHFKSCHYCHFGTFSTIFPKQSGFAMRSRNTSSGTYSTSFLCFLSSCLIEWNLINGICVVQSQRFGKTRATISMQKATFLLRSPRHHLRISDTMCSCVYVTFRTKLGVQVFPSVSSLYLVSISSC